MFRQAERIDYDAGKKIKGKMRHIVASFRSSNGSLPPPRQRFREPFKDGAGISTLGLDSPHAVKNRKA